ncbi:AIPR family protein [Listeria grandensis]|uniref:AIPR family protein n=1 Tax=Listeria grandensis TaxID=1494963 RepID=A0A7X1CPJ9_9LIST|nr:AIPR family protein [Listeria grandensis]MBC1936083.1 AIPR family protein [Listeria grandensis]MBC6316102.1 AIPR family protein [Listeria grandensis]
MSDLHELKQFYADLKDSIKRENDVIEGWEEPFLYEMMSYIDSEKDIISSYWSKAKKNIKINAYLYEEEENILNLYIVYFDQDQAISGWKKTSKTEMKEYATKVKRFISQALKEELYKLISPSDPVYELAKLIYEQKYFATVNIFVLTNRYYETNKPIDISMSQSEITSVTVIDIERVYQLVLAEVKAEDVEIICENEFGDNLNLLKVPSSSGTCHECFMGYVSAEGLAKAYHAHGPKLVERNVRSFLQARATTNKGIKRTLENEVDKQKFVAYNNGISCIAKSAKMSVKDDKSNLYSIESLKGLQIVNGGQTTASIYEAYRKDIDISGVYLQVKLTILDFSNSRENDRRDLEDEMIANISRYANTQNKINASDLEANGRVLVELEILSRKTFIPSQDERKPEHMWYFERARGQYLVDVGRRKKGKEQKDFKKRYPKENLIQKIDMAKHYLVWEGHPYVVSKGGEAAFKKYMELNHEIEVEDLFYKESIAKTIIYRHIEDIIKRKKFLGYRANIIYYTTSWFSLRYKKNIDLLEVWNKQTIGNEFDENIGEMADQVSKYLTSIIDSGRNVTQWAKQVACWEELINKYESASRV